MAEDGNKAREFWDGKAESRAEQTRGGAFSPLNRLYEESCWRVIEPLLPEGGARVLEAGCGTGRWVFRLAPLGHRVTLTDFSPEMVRVAEREVRDRGMADAVDGYHVLDICDMHALADATFDLVLALGEPLGLCADAGKALAEMRRVTKPGGHVVCDVANRFRQALDLAKANHWSLAAEVVERGERQSAQGFTHHSFTPDSLRALYESNALQVTTLTASCPFLSFPPDKAQLEALQDAQTYATAQTLFTTQAHTPEMLAVSSRLLIAGKSV